ncbi:hypothetical protein Tco_1074798 [Tanacetum coccineum]
MEEMRWEFVERESERKEWNVGLLRKENENNQPFSKCGEGYEAKCANIGYDFLLFSFSSFGELENDEVTLQKRIRKFSVTQDIGARTAVHIFSRIGFAIARGVGAQIVSRLSTNFL